MLQRISVQDYDIVYVVTEISSFLNDTSWLDVFRDLLLIQEPDKNNQSYHMDFDQSYAYFMLFMDGNWIDLRFRSIETFMQAFLSMMIKLLYKIAPDNLKTAPPKMGCSSI
ncbi:aminoglycoside 6-adenylyltransferase [Lysinibacillus sp. NPDC092081]|uniref:aminoglycoside 6-adenylyltransferase n=1 Tax=Lysinibacillus sp. NPDC092081 TaxID=3364131 RepID=UPI00381AE8E1